MRTEEALRGVCYPRVVLSSRSSAMLALFACCLASGSAAWSAEPRPQRDPEGPSPRVRGERDRQPDGEARQDRRDIEGGGSGTSPDGQPVVEEPMLALQWRNGGCAVDGHRTFVKQLLAAENPSALMSLEVWGDSHEYVPYQKVFYYMRVPRQAYVTLFWVGPSHDIFVPFMDLQIPPNRDVSVDPESIVVPPLGREQWVAVATLEPLSFACDASEAAHLAWLRRLRALPHGVGRWEVRSKETRTPARARQQQDEPGE